MTKFLYTILIYIYKSVITAVSPFHEKAKLKVQGIKKSKSELLKFVSKNQGNLVLIHCSSQGEHEQALPIIRWILENSPFRIILSFYSPSGYRNAFHSNNPGILKIYLPFDTPGEMSFLLSTIRPKKVIIIKNEWWWNLLYELRSQKIESYLVSATFRRSHYFIKYPIAFFRNALKAFSTIFVVDETSKKIISKCFDGKICITGDTRIDQVNFLKRENSDKKIKTLPKRSQPVIVYGSVWESDLVSIKALIDFYPEATHLIYPHELGSTTLQTFEKNIPNSQMVRNAGDITNGIYIITSMGELKYAYRWSTFSYIGGGFGVGIHNILEAAVYYIPTLFGMNYHKSNEARYLVENNCAFAFQKTSELKLICEKINKESNRKEIESKLKSYFSPEYSPTEIICQEIFMKNEINV